MTVSQSLPTIVWTYELARSYNARQWHRLTTHGTSCGAVPTYDWVYGASRDTRTFKLCKRCFAPHLYPINVVHATLVTKDK